MKGRRIRKALHRVLAALMVVAMIIPGMPVAAADQTQHGSEGVVAYQHDGLPDTEKRVSYGNGGTRYTTASDIRIVSPETIG